MKEENETLKENLDFLQTRFPILPGTRILLAGLQPELGQAADFFKDKDVLTVLVDLEKVLGIDTDCQKLETLEAEQFDLFLGESCLDLALLLPEVKLSLKVREKLIQAMLDGLKREARWVELGAEKEIAQGDLDYLRKINVRNLLMNGEPGGICLISCLPAKRA